MLHVFDSPVGQGEKKRRNMIRLLILGNSGSLFSGRSGKARRSSSAHQDDGPFVGLADVAFIRAVNWWASGRPEVITVIGQNLTMFVPPIKDERLLALFLNQPDLSG